MTGAELGMVVGVLALFFVVFIVTVVVTKANSKEIINLQNVYLVRLANSDASIRNAMKYLKLTNGIISQSNASEGKN